MAATLAEGETSSKTAPANPKSPTSPPCSSPWARRSKAPAPPPSASRASKLHGARHRINPDRIEAGTFLIAGAITGGDLNVDCCEPRAPRRAHLKARTSAASARRRQRQHSRPLRRQGGLKAVDISTEEYPGFPTDMQAQYMALATQAKAPPPSPKTSSKTASCTSANSTAWARTSPSPAAPPQSAAKPELQSAAVMCSDLRASAALVLAALVADGESILDRVYHMDRGYERTSKRSSAASAPRSAAWATSSAKNSSLVRRQAHKNTYGSQSSHFALHR
jgi:UDP-N-acetylglucosamine 1-carboxyvinyltransferase